MKKNIAMPVLVATVLALAQCGCSWFEDEKPVDPKELAYHNVQWGEDYQSAHDKLWEEFKVKPEPVMLREDEKPFFDYKKLVDKDLLARKLGGKYDEKRIYNITNRIFNIRVFRVRKGDAHIKFYFTRTVPYTPDSMLTEKTSPNYDKSKTALVRVKYVFDIDTDKPNIYRQLKNRYPDFQLTAGRFQKKEDDLLIEYYEDCHEGEKGPALSKFNERVWNDFALAVNNNFLGILSEDIVHKEKKLKATVDF